MGRVPAQGIRELLGRDDWWESPDRVFFYLEGFEFDRWLNTPGWPPYLPDLSPGDSLMKPAEELAELWVTSELDMQAIEAVSIATWKTYQLVYFLDKILQKSPLPPGKDRGLPP